MTDKKSDNDALVADIILRITAIEKRLNNKQELTNDILMADVMLRVTAIEKLLIEKGNFTQEELANSTEEIAKRVAKVVLEKAQASKNIEEFIGNLEAGTKNKKGLDN